MFLLLDPKLKDTIRTYGNDERQIIYYRDQKKCGVCNSEIVWDELEIHHIEEHQHGGATSFDNAISVHAVCHPKGNAAIEFAKKWYKQN